MFQNPKPFGQQPAFSGFSNTTTTPFGQSSFAKPATTGFNAPAFGTTAGTSLFGQNTQTPGTGLFGTAAQGSAFGQQPAQPGFGFSSTPSTGLFGQQSQPSVTPATGSLFGTNTSTAFGQKSFGFGTTGAGTSLFGQQQTQQPQATSVFGQTNPAQTSNIFGASTGGFGQTAPQGTTIKFTPPTGTDSIVKNGHSQSINTRHNCITCMKEYESKSLEELRLEDYAANRKGPQAGGTMFGQTQPTIGPFGGPSTSTSGGLFGATTENKTLFGQPSTSSMSFGSNAGSFGAAPQTGSLFGKPATSFGTATTSTSGFGFNAAPSTNPFGANTQAKPFGTPATQPSNFFGSQPAQPSTGFGTTQSTFGNFGSQPNQSVGLFNQNKPAFSLGTSSSAFSFGQNTSTTAGTTGLFGAKPAAPAFGAQNAFGVPASGTTAFSSSFGTPATTQSTSLFSGTGFNKPTAGFTFPQTSTNSSLGMGLMSGSNTLFGNTQQKPGGLFSGGSTTFGSTGLGNTMGFGTGTALNTGSSFGTNTALGQGLGGIQGNQSSQLAQQQLLALASMPYGDSPLFRNLLPTGRASEILQPTNPAAQKAVLNSSAQYKVSPHSGSKVKVKIGYPALVKKSIFEGLEEDDGTMGQTFQPRPNPKRLIIAPAASRSQTPKDTNVASGGSSRSDKENTSPRSPGSQPPADADWLRKGGVKSPVAKKGVHNITHDGSFTDRFREPVANSTVSDLQVLQCDNEEPQSSRENDCELRAGSSSSPLINTTAEDKGDAQSINGSSSSDDSQEEDSVPQLLDAESHPTGIVCRRVGYFTIPALDELTGLMSDDGSCVVDNFTVGRHGYGNVYFEGPFDVADLNLDEIVHFRHKEVVIYPEDDRKPPVGNGLNRRAQVTLDRVWPIDKTTHDPITNPDRLAQMDYESKLRRVCAKMNARFKDYRPVTGSWVFTVDHFSKYGMTDSDEDDGPAVIPGTAPPNSVPGSDVKKQKLTPVQDKALSKIDKSSKTSPSVYGKDISKGLGGLAMDAFPQKPGQMEIDRDREAQLLGYVDDMIGKRVSQIMSPVALLAKEMGTSAHKVQLMKSSFFMGGDEEDIEMNSYLDIPPMYSEVTGLGGVGDGDATEFSDEEDFARMFPVLSKFGLLRSQLPTADVATPGIRKIVPAGVSVESSVPNMQMRTLGPTAAPIVVKPRTVMLKHHGCVSIPKEIIQGRCLSDMTLMRGASFRVGWSTASTFLSLSSVHNMHSLMSERGQTFRLTGERADLSLLLTGREIKDTSARVLNRIQLCGGDTVSHAAFKDSIEGHLRIQLGHSKSEIQGDCPLRIPSHRTSVLQTHSNLAQHLSSVDDSAFLAYHSEVWDLCVALWGDLQQLENCKPNSHQAVMVRREAVSQWLESVANCAVEQETAAVFDNIDPLSLRGKEEHIEGIISLLSGRQIISACEKAQEFGDHYCAMLLSQLCGGVAVRKLMQEQLASWQESGADAFIDPRRLQVMLLVAGLPVFELSSNSGIVNTCNKLDWKRAFAIHLWYLCSPVASVPDALLLYQKAFSASNEDSGDAYAKRPDPPYLDYMSDDYVETSQGRRLNDLCYHLLQLYSDRSHPLEQLLNPATHTPDPLDYRLSWCLKQVLETLGYSHLSPMSAAIIHTGFAAQLESHGLWEWAIFVLLHLADDARRKSSVFDMLSRHVQLLDSRKFTDQEEFLHRELGLPVEWIYRAKAVLASVNHRYADQAWYLICAREWNNAHVVIMEHIAADAIINEDLEELEFLLRKLEPAERNCAISSWIHQGALLWDYLSVIKAVEELLAIVVSAPDGGRDLNASYKLERLQPQLNSLCTRINNFPCRNAKDRLCQCEIAKRASTLIRNVTQLQQGESGVWSQALSHLVAQLPLPEDYAQQELQQLSNAHVS